jgi:hypothetical protein
MIMVIHIMNNLLGEIKLLGLQLHGTEAFTDAVTDIL